MCNDLFSEEHDGGHDIAIEHLDNKRIIAHAKAVIVGGVAQQTSHCRGLLVGKHETYRLDGAMPQPIRTKALEDFRRAIQADDLSKCAVEMPGVRKRPSATA